MPGVDFNLRLARERLRTMGGGPPDRRLRRGGWIVQSVGDGSPLDRPLVGNKGAIQQRQGYCIEHGFGHAPRGPCPA